MAQQKQRENGNAMRGVLAAIAPSWLVLVGATGLTFWQIGLRNNPSPWLVAYIWVVWGSIFPALSFGSGVICAFFWQPIIAGENYRKWSGWATLGIFAPMIFGCGGGCLTLMIAYLPCLWLFNKGVAQGLIWWPTQRWRHFFGLRNDYQRDNYEREENER